MLLTKNDVIKKIKELENEGYIWKPVGGNRNNEGAIQMLTEPISGLAERITNAIDAVLEKYHYLKPNSKNPIELANEIYHSANEDLKDLVTVSIYDSKNKETNKSMTIFISDKGIGVKEEDFEKTILKLGGSNKISKKYLMGAYGQGGSTSIKFNEYTVIYSRTKESDEVMTIIRHNWGKEEEKNGSYEYICLNKNENSSFAKSNILKNMGTKIVNISNFCKKTGKIGNNSKSLSLALNNKLFSPPLQFQIIDYRNKSKEPNKQIIKGVRNQLNSLIKNNEYFDEKSIKTKQGSIVKLRWWVIMPSLKDKISTAYKYLKDVRTPFNFTMNGQTQGYFGNKLLNDSELTFLKKQFICEIDLTKISKKERSSILLSSRESISFENDFWEELQKKIIDYLFSFNKLKKINNEIKNMMMITNQNVESFDKNFHKIMKELIPSFIKNPKEISEEKNYKSNSKNIQNIENNIELKMIPTFFHLIQNEIYEFSSDILKIQYKTNGLPKIILNNLQIDYTSTSIKYVDKKQTKTRGQIIFDAKNMKINDELTINFNILNGLFKKSILVRKINPNPKKNKLGYPKPKIIILYKEKDSNYIRLDFNKKTPCRIDYSAWTNLILIYLNMANYEFIKKYLNKPDILKRFQNHYSVGMALYIVSQIQIEKNKNYENYDYNHIAKSLTWSFDCLEKLK